MLKAKGTEWMDEKTIGFDWALEKRPLTLDFSSLKELVLQVFTSGTQA